MLLSTNKKIEQKIGRLPKGKIIFITDFQTFGSDVAVRQSLNRLVKTNKIIRLTQGIYYNPKVEALLGIIYPSTEQIAEAIARRDKARIIPTGAFALYKLGLSTQIPMNVVYLTDGSSRKIHIGKQKITFKKTSPRNLAIRHDLSNLIIQAIKELGESNISKQDMQNLKKIILLSGECKIIEKNIRNAVVWVQKYVLQITNEIEK